MVTVKRTSGNVAMYARAWAGVNNNRMKHEPRIDQNPDNIVHPFKLRSYTVVGGVTTIHEPFH